MITFYMFVRSFFLICIYTTPNEKARLLPNACLRLETVGCEVDFESSAELRVHMCLIIEDGDAVVFVERRGLKSSLRGIFKNSPGHGLQLVFKTRVHRKPPVIIPLQNPLQNKICGKF